MPHPYEHQETPSRPSWWSPPAGWVTLGLLVLVGGSVGLGLFAKALGTHSETFRFIALLIIFMTALGASAAVFAGLRMGNSAEAFGLPGGSVRALLAIGIMILFVVFGLPVVNPPLADPIGTRQVPVPAAQVDADVSLYRAQGLTVLILDRGAAEVAPTATTPSVPARPARLEISGRPELRSSAATDLAKQLLTAIITLLTTVIGFYFGSRSATEAIRDATADSGHGDGEDGGVDGGGGGGGGDDDTTANNGNADSESDIDIGTRGSEDGGGADGGTATAGDAAVEEATPERSADGVNRQEADDLPDEGRSSVSKLDPDETTDGR